MTLRHLFDWQHIADEDWAALVQRGVRFSEQGFDWRQVAHGKALALVFFNPSLRTRASMDLAAAQLGAHATVLEPGKGTWGTEWNPGTVMDGTAAEHITEAIGVLSRYYDALGVRVFAAGEDYAEDRDEVRFKRIMAASTVPVINLESAFFHPCQALADAVTLHRHFNGQAQGKRLVLHWCYHPRALPMAVPNSTLLMAARMGMRVTVARPGGFELDPQVMSVARRHAQENGGEVLETEEPGCDDAHIVYAKAWGGNVAYDNPDAEAELRGALKHWRITESMQQRGDGAHLMHPLPVRRNVVVDDAVLDGSSSLHLDQAENRVHAQKAILEWVWNV